MQELNLQGHADLDGLGILGIHPFYAGIHPRTFVQLNDARTVRIISVIALCAHKGRADTNAGKSAQFSLPRHFFPCHITTPTFQTDGARRDIQGIALRAAGAHQFFFLKGLSSIYSSPFVKVQRLVRLWRILRSGFLSLGLSLSQMDKFRTGFFFYIKTFRQD
jgi:hypothetical protein